MQILRICKKIIKMIDDMILGGKVKHIILKVQAKKSYYGNYYLSGQQYPYRGYEALNKLLEEYEFQTVLDVGCGAGEQSKVFSENGKIVTGLDYGESEYYRKNNYSTEVIKVDINNWETDKKFECIWCSHVLEHQLNVNFFLRKLYSLLDERGVLAITVPPLKQTIVGGHVSLWTPGLLLYNLILAGFDCSQARIKVYDYDISIIVQKTGKPTDLSKLEYDCGDIRRIKKYLPENISFYSNDIDDPFDGNISELNW